MATVPPATFPAGSPFRWSSASATHPGRVRQINEDACFEAPERGLWAIADGMGGHTLGDFASQAIIDALARVPAAGTLAEALRNTRQGLQAVNHQLRREAASRAVQVIGSTVAVLLARGGQCACLWAGDSRIYLYRRGQLTRLTRDHSQVEKMQSLGLLDAGEAASHPLRHLITRAVGAADHLDVDETILAVEDGDLFLLCSDGLNNEVGDDRIGAALAPGQCRQAADLLVGMALRQGGRDNISVIVARADVPLHTDGTLLNPEFL